jgi:uncharacterized protein (TIGR02145 family)
VISLMNKRNAMDKTLNYRYALIASLMMTGWLILFMVNNAHSAEFPKIKGYDGERVVTFDCDYDAPDPSQPYLRIQTNEGICSISLLDNTESRASNFRLQLPHYQVKALKSEFEPCEEILIDHRDGQAYGVVNIGEQCWMSENLNYNNGCLGRRYSQMRDTGWCGPGNRNLRFGPLGLLYEWSAAMNRQTAEGSQGSCPHGWRVPTNQDWDRMVRYLGGYNNAAATKLKIETLPRVDYYQSGGTNESGFRAVPAGLVRPRGTTVYGLMGRWEGFWWTSTTNQWGDPTRPWNAYDWGSYAWFYNLDNAHPNVVRSSIVYRSRKDNAYAVRCIRAY